MNPPDQPPRSEIEHAWERRIDAELRRLPEMAAPAPLVSDVMRIVRAREAMRARVWWRRPATMWHPALRVAFAILGLVLLGAIVVAVRWLWPEVQATSEVRSISALGDKFAALWSAAQTVIEAIGLVLQSIFTPARLAILGAIILTQVGLLSAGVAALRATFRPRGAMPS